MLFNSSQFLVFLPVLLVLYYAAPTRLRGPILLLASYGFYGTWDWRFLFLLWLSTLLDFYVSRWIAASAAARKKQLLVGAMVANLTILGVFKYYNFFVGSLRALLEQAGLQVLSGATLDVVLPVGISFYTFQSMSYTIDVYRGDVEPVKRLRDFALYVAFFPHMVAGPIQRKSTLLPQLQSLRTPDLEQVRRGVAMAIVGFFKKVVVGDTLAAPYANRAFSDPNAHGGPFLFFGLCMFALQIYADFSGYSDIARGVSRFFGVELMINFEQPYLSRNITEFWRRWHISLSSWLRDYLYVPLGGNRRGRRRTYVNLMLTMLIGGLWHGASWTFVVWGGLHGAYLAVHRAAQGDAKPALDQPPSGARGWLAAAPGIVATNLLVLLGWLFFRAPNFAVARDYLVRLGDCLSSRTNLLLSLLALLFYFALVLLVDLAPYLTKDHELYERLPWPARGVLYGTVAALVWTCWPTAYAPFIYFQF